MIVVQVVGIEEMGRGSGIPGIKRLPSGNPLPELDHLCRLPKPGRNVPTQKQSVGRLVGQPALAAVDATVIQVAANPRLEHRLGGNDRLRRPRRVRLPRLPIVFPAVTSRRSLVPHCHSTPDEKPLFLDCPT